jgi:hypothetical protein
MILFLSISATSSCSVQSSSEDMLSKLIRLIQRSNVILSAPMSFKNNGMSHHMNLKMHLAHLISCLGWSFCGANAWPCLKACDYRYGQSGMPMVPISPGGKRSSLNSLKAKKPVVSTIGLSQLKSGRTSAPRLPQAETRFAAS